MSDLFEVVLKDVAPNNLLSLLKVLGANADKVTNVESSECLDIECGSGFSQEMIEAILACKSDLCVTAKLHSFKVINILVDSIVLLRVIKYEERIDVELCFEDVGLTDISEVMLVMQAYAKCLSERFYIEEFYGGLEPASDVETRYFTNETLGPLAK